MYASALIPATAGWAPARACHRPRDTRRTLLRNALLLSSSLHLAAGLGLSYLLRERVEDAVVTLAMRPRVALLPRQEVDPDRLEIARPAPAGGSPETGLPVPVRESAASPLIQTLRDWLPVPGPVPGGAASGAVEAGRGDARSLPSPPEAAAALPLGTAVDEPPRVIHRVEPVYPPFALEAGLEGWVLLHVRVGADGTVREIRVAEGSEVFIESATEAVRRWQFRPARVGARAVPIWVEIPVRFRL